MYARSAADAWQSESPIRVPSPDHRFTLHAERVIMPASTVVRVRLFNAKRRVWQRSFNPGVGLNVLWAPNSRAFAVTSSSGGLNGIYETKVFVVGQDGVGSVDVTTPVLAAFGTPVKCVWPEPPNVGAIKWQKDSSAIVVAAQIVHHSNCDCAGTFVAYEVSVHGAQVVRRIGQLEAKRSFGSELGWMIADADDDCVLHPRHCWLENNHKKRK